MQQMSRIGTDTSKHVFQLPQLACRQGLRTLAVFLFEDKHDPANAPVRTVDFGDDHGLRHQLVRVIGRQICCRQLRVLQTHRDVGPVQSWRFRYSRVDQNRAQARTTIGESGHLAGVGPACGFQGPLDHCGDVGFGPGKGAKNLAATGLRLDVADENLQVAFAVFVASYEG
jgi:hypothetical protein